MSEQWPKLTKQDWLTLVQKELKDKDYASIVQRISPNISIEPYYTADETSGRMPPLIVSNTWESAEDFHFTGHNAADTNAAILEALNGGLQSLSIHCDTVPDPDALKLVLNGVSLGSVSVFFSFPQGTDALSVRTLLENVCHTGGISHDLLRGGILSNLHDAEMIAGFPLIKPLPINTGDHQCTQTPEIVLARLLFEADSIWEKSNPSDHHALVRQFHFTLHIGNDFLTELSKLRAMYLLWANYQLARGIERPSEPYIHAVFCRDAYTEDENKNMIKASAMAMAAVAGGAARITVTPTGTEQSSFQRRIARNVLNLLDLEAGMRLVPDPAAGSYYFENLTEAIAQAAWDHFLNQKKRS